MALDKQFLEYPMRKHGMDHDLYDWSNLFERKPIDWGNGKKIALQILIPVEFFPLNQQGKPFKAPGSMVTAYPDFRHYTSRDYGNRVGIYRFLKLFSSLGITANFAVNSQVATRYPQLINDILEDGHEILAHGINMDILHYGGMDSTVEQMQIEQSVQTLETICKRKINGWISPAFSQSFETPELLGANGIKYCGDWSNDDLPYWMKTKNGDLLSLSISQELSDRQIITNNHHTEESFVQQVQDQFEVLSAEVNKYGGRMLSLILHPYIMGLPYRICYLKQMLSWLLQQENTKSFTANEIYTTYINHNQ
jgi:allantoinase